MPLIVDEKWLKDYTARTGKGVQGDGRPHPSAAPAPSPFRGGRQEGGDNPSPLRGAPFAQGSHGDNPSSVGCADTFPSERGKARELTAGASPRPTGEQKRSKYGNIRTETEDGTFDSRHEAKVWEELKLRARAGEIRAVGRQAVFFLPGGVRYIADFVIWTDDGEIQVLDAKSEATKKDKTYRIKKRLMLDTFGIDIKEV